ncbi:MAG: hypothetical protein ABI171_01575 [Collimonas sp.]|uniref:hypothetical protein n=1 Tax=Collimonas sp. TaxID=1963772 RepID=UPI00326437BD
MVHLAVATLWWHQADATIRTAGDANTGRDSYVDVRLITTPPQAIATKTAAEITTSAGSRPEAAKTRIAELPPQSSMPIFFGPQDVDKSALPYSAPDAGLMSGLAVSGLPIRLRLYIDAKGLVIRVEQLQALDDDRRAVEQITKMLVRTAFTPARLNGMDVNSYLDLEFNIAPDLHPSDASL